MNMITYGWVLLLLFQNAKSANTDEVMVETKVGKIVGVNSNDGGYNMFLGIPYAKIGDNPFASSTPYPPFNHTFKANDGSVMCPQMNKVNKIIGCLDCLRLNIYVPSSVSQNKKLPVMVWIHGGRFEIGFGGRYSYDPRYLVRHQVIVVTLNYRLGPYGFMCLDIPEVSGNQGLKDQYLAFKWIKENIQAFGGNADQITLFGQSAGGHSIDLHLMSTTNILFHKVILESGSAQALTVLYEPDKSAALTLAKHTGFETNDTRKALNFLSKLDTRKVIAATNNLKIQFKPCVETKYDGIEPFIARPWIDEEVPKVKDMPVLMGFNKLEFASILIPRELEFLSNSSIVNDRIGQVFDIDNKDLDETKDFVSHFYFGDDKIDKKSKWPLIRFLSDFTYIHPVHRTLKKYLDYEAKCTYFYMFSYVGGRNIVRRNDYDEHDSNDNLCCASHTDELRYLFNGQNYPKFTNADRIIMKRMTIMWTNFAKYSNPTPKKTELLPVKWEPVTKETLYYLNIDTKLALGKRPLHARMAFWDLFYKHNKKSQKLFVKV